MDEYKNNKGRIEWAKRVASRELEHLNIVLGVEDVKENDGFKE